MAPTNMILGAMKYNIFHSIIVMYVST